MTFLSLQVASFNGGEEFGENYLVGMVKVASEFNVFVVLNDTPICLGPEDGHKIMHDNHVLPSQLYAYLDSLCANWLIFTK